MIWHCPLPVNANYILIGIGFIQFIDTGIYSILIYYAGDPEFHAFPSHSQHICRWVPWGMCSAPGYILIRRKNLIFETSRCLETYVWMCTLCIPLKFKRCFGSSAFRDFAGKSITNSEGSPMCSLKYSYVSSGSSNCMNICINSDAVSDYIQALNRYQAINMNQSWSIVN